MSRLHSVARAVLVLALVASTQGLLLAQAAWLTNQEWIAETLCVNRDRPELKCDGKCQLSARMEHMEHDHSHDEAPPPLLELALSVRAHVAERVVVPALLGEPLPGPVLRLAKDTGREASHDVFHPPRVGPAA